MHAPIYCRRQHLSRSYNARHGERAHVGHEINNTRLEHTIRRAHRHIFAASIGHAISRAKYQYYYALCLGRASSTR